MKRARSNHQATPVLSWPSSGPKTVPAINRRCLLSAARRLLWSLLRACARGARQTLRGRLRDFLRTASCGTLLRLVRQTTAAGAVALALATSANAADAIELSDVRAGRGGFVVGAADQQYSYFSVSEAGDVNGDGFADVVVGGSAYDPGYHDVYVVFGKATTEAVDLADIAEGRGGFAIRRESPTYGLGNVSGAGDVNGDGFADLIIGNPGWCYCGHIFDYDTQGSYYVVFGKDNTDPVDLADVVAGRGGFVTRGGGNEQLGIHVSGAGDVDGDGLTDLVARTRGYRRHDRSGVIDYPGMTEVSFANGGWFAIRDDDVFLDARLTATGAGDVDGDGLADIVIGAPTIDPRGASYVVFGKETTTLAEVAAGNGGFVIRGESEGDLAGYSVSSAGDVNDDDLADLLIGAPGADATYLVFGKKTTEVVNLADVKEGNGGLMIRGEPGDGSGGSVSGAGDVDGDGLADLLIGAALANATYLVFGKKTTEVVELGDIAGGTGGLVIRGQLAVESVSGGGDINGDGVPDVIVGHTIVFGPLREGVPRFRRGEVNGDLQIDISDGIATLGYLFLGEEAPACLDGADANDDGQIDISDTIATLGYLFLGSARPPVPGPTHCGIDPTDDALDCEGPPEDCR